jgi:hypothetical protein
MEITKLDFMKMVGVLKSSLQTRPHSGLILGMNQVKPFGKGFWTIALLEPQHGRKLRTPDVRVRGVVIGPKAYTRRLEHFI